MAPPHSPCFGPGAAGKAGVFRRGSSFPPVPRAGRPLPRSPGFARRNRQFGEATSALLWPSHDQGATHVETPMSRRAGFLVLSIGLVVLLTAPLASAKGAATPRGYAVVEGPGLAHPIVISAPWSAAKLGYFGDEAEIFINFATFAGAIPGATTNSSQA